MEPSKVHSRQTGARSYRANQTASKGVPTTVVTDAAQNGLNIAAHRDGGSSSGGSTADEDNGSSSTTAGAAVLGNNKRASALAGGKNTSHEERGGTEANKDGKTGAGSQVVDGGSSPATAIPAQDEGFQTGKGSTMVSSVPSTASAVASPAAQDSSKEEEESLDDEGSQLGHDQHSHSGEGRTCMGCKRSKVKCSRGSPCSRCTRLKLVCVAQTRGRGRPIATHKRVKLEPASTASLTGAGEAGAGGGVDTNILSFPSFMGGVLPSPVSIAPGVLSSAATAGLATTIQQSHQPGVLGDGDAPCRRADENKNNNAFVFAGEMGPTPALLAPLQGFGALAGTDAYRDGNLETEGREGSGGGGGLPPSQVPSASLVSPQHGYIDSFDACRPFPSLTSSGTPGAFAAFYGAPPMRMLAHPPHAPGGGQQIAERPSWPGILDNSGGGGGGGGNGGGSNGGEDKRGHASTMSWDDMSTNHAVATTARGTRGASGGAAKGPTDGFSNSTEGSDSGGVGSGNPGNGERNSLTAGLDSNGSGSGGADQGSAEPLGFRDSNGAIGRGMSQLWGGAMEDGRGIASNRVDGNHCGSGGGGGGGGGGSEGVRQKPPKQPRWHMGVDHSAAGSDARQDSQHHQSQHQREPNGAATLLPAFPVGDSGSDTGRDGTGSAADSGRFQYVSCPPL